MRLSVSIINTLPDTFIKELRVLKEFTELYYEIVRLGANKTTVVPLQSVFTVSGSRL